MCTKFHSSVSSLVPAHRVGPEMEGIVKRVIEHSLFRAGRSADFACPEDWQINDLAFEDYDLWYIRRGAGMLTRSGVEFNLRPGQLYLFRPGDVISARQIEDDRLRVYFCDFSPANNSLFKYLSFPFVTCDSGDRIADAFRLFFREAGRCGDVSSFSVRLLLYSVFQFWLQAGEVSLKGLDQGVSGFEALLRAIDFMEFHRNERLSLLQLSKVCAMEKSGLTRLFKKLIGKSPIKYHNELRMSYAGFLLDAGASVKEVSTQTGYADTFSFSKAFKRVTGRNPSELPTPPDASQAI